MATPSAPNRIVRGSTLAALSLLATVAIAQQPVKPPNQQSDTELNTVTVEAQRESLKRQVRTFVSAITMQRFGDSSRAGKSRRQFARKWLDCPAMMVNSSWLAYRESRVLPARR